jgi:cobalt/nickel transport system permease protein
VSQLGGDGVHHRFLSFVSPVTLLRTVCNCDIVVVVHAPDGFLNAGTAVATGAISLGTVGMALRQVKQTVKENQVPLAGIAAAFIFAAQMLNFPVAAGTTGHLLGGALAAILLGPSMGAVVVTVVVVIQSLVFADGGMTALGYNVLNMAIIPAFGGYALFLASKKLLPATSGGVVAAAGLAAWGSVLLSAMAFSIEWLFGATAPVSFAEVFGAMVGTHLLIGMGEGVISALALGTVLASRPDLVVGVKGLPRTEPSVGRRIPVRTFIIGGALTALLLAGVVSQFAADDPDGLEAVANETGIIESAGDHPLDSGVFADYATAGIRNESLSLAIAGVAGTLIVLAVGTGVFAAVRQRRDSTTTV